jgi:hypothetical protein
MKTRIKVAVAAPVVGVLVGGLGLGTMVKAAPAHACEMMGPGNQTVSCDPPPGAPGGPLPPPPQAPIGPGNYGTCNYYPSLPICRGF